MDCTYLLFCLVLSNQKIKSNSFILHRKQETLAVFFTVIVTCCYYTQGCIACCGISLYTFFFSFVVTHEAECVAGPMCLEMVSLQKLMFMSCVGRLVVRFTIFHFEDSSDASKAIKSFDNICCVNRGKDSGIT